MKNITALALFLALVLTAGTSEAKNLRADWTDPRGWQPMAMTATERPTSYVEPVSGSTIRVRLFEGAKSPHDTAVAMLSYWVPKYCPQSLDKSKVTHATGATYANGMVRVDLVCANGPVTWYYLDPAGENAELVVIKLDRKSNYDESLAHLAVDDILSTFRLTPNYASR